MKSNRDNNIKKYFSIYLYLLKNSYDENEPEKYNIIN